ncbi:Acriflavin resistance protein [Thiomonas sp. X19]|uniref:efflux RND transporter permease subunit n=1 Tax=Thiomonas sp. X19 TaxID=1050370 RepID=UPI000B6AE19A|nr:efflux RND transporter permease subunit [Thiomonas sp. X19]SCC95604.1 Acriflavin resistance protein [Thiomonas sp. X19]
MAEGAPMNSAGRLARAFISSKITALVMVALTLVGVLALLVTPREYNPQIVVPAANIIVAKPGAGPQEIQNLVVKPLEAIMASMSGVDHTYGYATNDFGVVTVQFKVGEDQEKSLVKMYNQLMQNLDRIPPGAMQPVIKPINVDDVPILTLTLSSASMGGVQLRDVGEKVLAHLRNVPGVSFTEVVGGAPRAVNVWISPSRLAAAGIPLEQLDKILQGSNAAAPIGNVVDNNQVTPVRVDSFLGNAQQVGDIMIGAPGGKPVYLKDVARVVDGPEHVDDLSHFAWGLAAKGKPHGQEMSAVTLAIAKKSGTNAVVVVHDVLAKLDIIKSYALPQGVHVTVTRDDGHKANEAVNTLVEHLGIAIVSVSLLLWFFLGWREAGIVTLTVPLTLFAVLAVDLIIGQSINRITLFALILSLGLLVDGAIVVIENIHRHLHSGPKGDFISTVIEATNEIGNPTNMATLAVILAFIPMAFVSGMMGPFMRPIPINVPVAMIASLLLAYIVVPWAARVWLSKKAAREALARSEALEEQGARQDDKLHTAYLKLIEPMLKSRTRRNLMLLAVLLLLIAAMLMPAWQFIRPSGMNGPLSPLGVELKMLPNDNTNTFLVQVDTPAGSSLERTDEVARAVGDVLATNPYVVDFQTFVGEAAPIDFASLVRGDMLKRGDNFAQIRVNLVGKNERSIGSHAIVQQLDERLAAVRARFPSSFIKLFETPPGPPVRAQVMAELYGPNYDTLRSSAKNVLADFDKTYGLMNQDDSVTATTAEYRIEIDRQKAAMSGIVPGQVIQLLHNYVSGMKVGAIHDNASLEPINIIVRVPRADRQSPQQLLDVPIQNAQGKIVPLASIATVEKTSLAKPIYTRDQHPVVYVGGEMIHSSPVYATLSLNSRLDGKKLANGTTFTTGNLGFTDTPASDLKGYQLLWGGEMRLTLDVFRDLGSAFMVALVFIYLLLVAYYRSFLLPVIVMGAIPLTLIGVFPGHWITHQAFTATSMIGVIALAGVVVRNSLLLIDFILDYRARGYSLQESVAQAGAVRLRPILLTALAIIFGSAVMVSDPVFGGLAVSLIFGTLLSTILTLIVIPLLYYIWQLRVQSPPPMQA